MLSKNKSRWFAATLTMGLSLVLLGTTCPIQLDQQNGGNGGDGGPTTLVSESFGFVPPVRNFSPSAAGRLITATVSGDATGSRIAVTITDLSTGSVVAQQLAPTTNSTTVTFTSTNNGTHTIASLETGAGSATYTVLVTEQ